MSLEFVHIKFTGKEIKKTKPKNNKDVMCNKLQVFEVMNHSSINPTFPYRATVMPLVIVNLQW